MVRNTDAGNDRPARQIHPNLLVDYRLTPNMLANSITKMLIMSI